jgi:SAM-dependent methyltransferase
MSNLYHKLDFPLNVYAQSLYLQEGKVDYLHYGLFKPEESLLKVCAHETQQRSTDLLFSQLPPPPARILEIGIGLGTTAFQLAQRGYTLTAISPDAAQIALAQQLISENITLECVSLEAFSASPASYDVILCQESAQYIPALTLFNQAHELLAPNGLVLIADEIALQRTTTDIPYSLPFLTSTLAQAQRAGFELQEKIDLSQQAAPTVDYLLWVIEKHRAALRKDLDLNAIVLDELLNSLRYYQQKYRDGTYGYVLLKLAKTKTPRWKVAFVTNQDQKAVRELFSEVCKPEQMSAALWEWKYGQGRGLGIGAWQQHKMVAHYGSIQRQIHYFGQAKPAIQIADVMVLPKERAVLTRQGAFFLTAATYPECYVGYGNPIWLGYGFPNERAMKVAERLGLYASVGKMLELHWPSKPSQPFFKSRIRHLRPDAQAENKFIINKLWQKMALNLSNALVGVRDWDYIQHRYLSHPHHHYELLLITRRFTGQALGVAVIQRRAEMCRLMDFIGDLKHIPEIIRQVRRIAGVWGMSKVTTWITANFGPRFPQQDIEVIDIKVQVPHSIWTPGVPPAEINGHWWLMIGDTDFL